MGAAEREAESKSAVGRNNQHVSKDKVCAKMRSSECNDATMAKWRSHHQITLLNVESKEGNGSFF
jgi:hypothetical protein